MDIANLKQLSATFEQGLAQADHDFVAGRIDKRALFKTTKSLYNKYRSESRKYLR